ncbi:MULTISPECIES: hypothetical protein [Streptomyces]|nr:hypothetical protein [Streptomyces sp. TP-A0356]
MSTTTADVAAAAAATVTYSACKTGLGTSVQPLALRLVMALS